MIRDEKNAEKVSARRLAHASFAGVKGTIRPVERMLGPGGEAMWVRDPRSPHCRILSPLARYDVHCIYLSRWLPCCMVTAASCRLQRCWLMKRFPVAALTTSLLLLCGSSTRTSCPQNEEVIERQCTVIFGGLQLWAGGLCCKWNAAIAAHCAAGRG